MHTSGGFDSLDGPWQPNGHSLQEWQIIRMIRRKLLIRSSKKAPYQEKGL